MSDRTYCCLTVWGILDATSTQSVLDAICNWDGSKPEELHWMLDGHSNAYFDFDEVAEGQLDPAVHHVLQSAGLGYSWEFGPSIENSSGVFIYNPLTGQESRYAAVEQKILIPLDQAADPEKLSQANEAQKFWSTGRSLGLFSASSAHARMEALRERPNLQPFAAALEARKNERSSQNHT